MPDINGIPYVESTDLVSGWPTVSQSVAQEVSDQLASKLDTTAYTDPALVLIATDSFSAVSAVNVNGCFTSTYANYVIKLQTTAVSADGLITLFRLRASGTDSSANYRHSASRSTWAGSLAWYTAANPGTSYYIHENTDVGVNVATIDVFGPALVQRTAMTHTAVRAGLTYEFGGCSHNAETAYDGFSLLTNTGTFTGNLRVYGYRNTP